jgi:hypothetical protein
MPFRWGAPLRRGKRGWLIAFGVLWLLPMIVVPGSAALLGALWLTGYSVVGPLVIFPEAPKGVETFMLVIAGWFGLFMFANMSTQIAAGHPMGDDAMIFLMPLILFVVLMPVGCVVRLGRVRARRRAEKAAAAAAASAPKP